MKDLIETWHIHNRIMVYMIENLSQAALDATLSTRGGRTVGMQLVHVYDIRRRKVEKADKVLGGQLDVLEREDGGDKALLIASFKRSGDAIAEVIEKSAEADGKVKGFKRGIHALVGYFISHDCHHRGHIFLTLKLAKVKRSREMEMGIWAWNQH